jgi:hypothetical protein
VKSSDDEPAGQESPNSAGDPVRSGLSPSRDPGLLHQPILEAKQNGSVVTVSCNCRLQWRGEGAMRRAYYSPMGQVTDRYDTQRLYNDPSNHTQPLTPKWEIHYKDVEG